MKSLLTKFGSGAAMLALLLGAAAMTANAQWRDRNYGYGDGRRVAFENGQRDGLRHGAEDRRNRRSFDPYRHGDYKDGDNGYRREYGDKDFYKRIFREGFLRGYESAYRSGSGYGDYDRDRDYRDRDYRGSGDHHDDRGWGGRGYDVRRIASDNGYRDGLRHGQEDRFRNRGYDLEDRDYRDATRGYRGEYGNRDEYRRAYRDGYRRGYDEGYRRSSSNRTRWGFPWPF